MHPSLLPLRVSRVRFGFDAGEPWRPLEIALATDPGEDDDSGPFDSVEDEEGEEEEEEGGGEGRSLNTLPMF